MPCLNLVINFIRQESLRVSVLWGDLCVRVFIEISLPCLSVYTQLTDQQRLAIDMSPDANPYGWMLDDPDSVEKEEDDGEHTRFVYFC